jgi:mannitol/fructose-specific phosphotransferase system IIA component (Ntr-type)
VGGAPAVDLAPLLCPARVIGWSAPLGKAEALGTLADLAVSDLRPHDRVMFVRGVLEREDVTSTGVGGGVAIPHARLTTLDRCRIAIGVCPAGIPWQANDGLPVRLAILIAAREADHAEHLRVMAALSIRLRRPGVVDRACALIRDPVALVGLITGG